MVPLGRSHHVHLLPWALESKCVLVSRAGALLNYLLSCPLSRPPPFFFSDMLTLNSLPVADTGFQLLIFLPFLSKCWDDTGSPVVDVLHCFENLACLKNDTHPLAPHPPFPITSLPCSSSELWVRISSFPGN